jgi:hypothetical protein
VSRPLPGTEAFTRRYARQIVLAEVGEAGQRALAEASAFVGGRGDAARACALLLSTAGVGRVVVEDADVARSLAGTGADVEAGDRPTGAVAFDLRDDARGAVALARGALEADAVLRAIWGREAGARRVVANDDATVSEVRQRPSRPNAE